MAKLRSIRTVGAWMVACAATSALTPLGCGAAQEDYAVVSTGQTMLAPAPENMWQPPEAIVAELRGCVKEHARDLKTYSHHTKFDLRVTEAGEVQSIDMQSSTLHHSALESCIGDVLKKLSIPSSAASAAFVRAGVGW